MENKPTILIAEDAESNFLYLNVILRAHFNILHAVDGVEAVRMAFEHNPDVILMDVKMPNKTGLVALSEIKAKNPDMPIIMQTAYAFDTDIEAAMQLGANGYLSKPIMKDKLLELIHKFI